MTKNGAKTALSLLAVIAVAAAIFLFSAQAGESSSQLSDRVTAALLTVLRPGFRQLSLSARRAYIARWSAVVRKLSHFSEYALLGLTLTGYLRLALQRWRMGALALLSWVIAAAYACTDELHQMFVSERSPALLDVGIDSAGALCGVLLALAWLALRARLRRRKQTI